MIIQAQPYGLHPKDISMILAELQKDRVGIVPTDSVYAFCCLANQKNAFEAICVLKHIDPKDALMSIVCKDLSQASNYFVQWPTQTYRILNKNLPGPFTFILQSGNRAPAFLKNKRKTLGLRIPQHPVIQSLMPHLDMPLLVSSVRSEDEDGTYFSDIDSLTSVYERQVSFIVIDEMGLQEESTVVDMTSDEVIILRQSKFQLKE
jgi:tRNA threonylcarbamoyl adenosine modification protein (Sua5/YciO/YrdC/YwlC family)